MTDWQPIETLEPEVCCSYILWAGDWVFTGWRTSEGQWHCDQFADHQSEVVKDPTHWMPFPVPPK